MGRAGYIYIYKLLSQKLSGESGVYCYLCLTFTDTPEWGTWGPWSPWLFDDDSGNTTRTRDRECVKVDERECDGESTQTQHCEDANKCPGKYDVIQTDKK